MSKNTILLFLIICCYFATTVSAEVSFTNSIDMSDNSISFTIHEIYTGEDAMAFRESLDADNDGLVNESETTEFKQHYLSSGGEQFLEYVVVDNGSTKLTIGSLDTIFDNTEGDTDDSDLYVTTNVLYLLNSTLSSGEHQVWVLGEYRIKEVSFVLPQGVELVSYDGLNNASVSTQDKRVLLRGESGVTSQMVGNVQRIESASIIRIKEEPFYANRFILPFLIIIEIILGSIALYIIKNNKNK